MKKLLIIFTLISLLVTAAACSSNVSSTNQTAEKNASQESTASYTRIKPEDAKRYLESEKDIVLLDVRTVEEYTEKHIPGSVLIPVDNIEKKAPEMLTNKDVKIFVYCRSGRRAQAAAEALVKMGYTKVYNLGGIIDWPYETEAGAPSK